MIGIFLLDDSALFRSSTSLGSTTDAGTLRAGPFLPLRMPNREAVHRAWLLALPRMQPFLTWWH